MDSLAVILFYEDVFQNTDVLATFKTQPFCKKIIIVATSDALSDVICVAGRFPFGGRCVSHALEAAGDCEYALILPATRGVAVTPEDIEKLLKAVKYTDAGMYYSDFYREGRTPAHVIPVADYQPGSIRDDFFFGPLQLYSLRHVRSCFAAYGRLDETRWAGLYELRLKVSLVADIARIPQPVGCVSDDYTGKTAHFSYISPDNLDYQKEMEQVISAHLRRTGAYCSHDLREVSADSAEYPVEASVIIPVRNREKTISDALKSALAQETDFAFNVIVVQNHSTDRTGEEIHKAARQDRRVIQIIPAGRDLGIGGCWNEAVLSPQCGRYVCQLDSDDLYAGNDSLATMIGYLRHGTYGMVVGAYKVVNFDLEEIPPGVVDHREWSDENGRNNLLRVQGIGAPRAFPTVILKQFPFPNISYGEDYAVALRISRDFRVGRIFTPLYLCRRWEGNTDVDLSPLEETRLAFLKDKIRTQELLARREYNKTAGNYHTMKKKHPPHMITDAELQPFLRGKSRKNLINRLSAFIEQQAATWLMLRKKREDLKDIVTKEIFLKDLTVIVQNNPHRIGSSSSNVDEASIKKRPCFLCPENLYPRQKGLPYAEDWHILNNPFPIFLDHLVVNYNSHAVQRLDTALSAMIAFVKDLDFSYCAFYNGPACGASAPDHLHFQACPRGGLPLIDQITGLVRSNKQSSVSVMHDHGRGCCYSGSVDNRGLFFCMSGDADVIKKGLHRAITFLEHKTPGVEEPMVNMIIAGMDDQYCALLLPRKRHRPHCFFKKDDTRVLVSPGAVDIGGLVILPRREDFNTINRDVLLEIFSEVCCDGAIFDGCMLQE